jgi:hypothetical protein
MNVADISIILLFISIFLFFFGVFLEKFTKRDGEGLIFCGVCCVAIMIIVSCATIAIPYWESYSLPQKYISATEAIEETKELLMRYENISDEAWSDIGEGLESLQLKQTLGEMIKDKYQYLAEIKAWLTNPWMPFKENIREGLVFSLPDI